MLQITDRRPDDYRINLGSRITYTPDQDPGPQSLQRQRVWRSQRIRTVALPGETREEPLPPPEPVPIPKATPLTPIPENLATSENPALRFLRSVVSAQPKVELVSPNFQQERRNSERRTSAPLVRSRSRSIALGDEGEEPSSQTVDMVPSLQALHHRASNAAFHHSSHGRNSPMQSRESLEHTARIRAASVSAASSSNNLIPDEKPIVSSTGVSVSINLAEPVLFLQGFQEGENAQRNTAMLRGALHLKVTKTAKIKAVTLKFKGTATTKWPEGKRFRLHRHLNKY